MNYKYDDIRINEAKINEANSLITRTLAELARYQSTPPPLTKPRTKKWADSEPTIDDTCRTERALLDMATTQNNLLLLVNYDWIFVENVELFKQRMQGV